MRVLNGNDLSKRMPFCASWNSAATETTLATLPLLIAATPSVQSSYNVRGASNKAARVGHTSRVLYGGLVDTSAKKSTGLCRKPWGLAKPLNVDRGVWGNLGIGNPAASPATLH